ncbi:MAG TPA: regulatory iron-sulfur-containing complex subunit RicT [Tepidiformaceae bacterium]
MRLEPGEYVVVETTRGPEVGRVVIAPGQVVVNEMGNEELKPILRLATEGDLLRAEELRAKAEDLLPEARALANEIGFPARIDAAEFTLDGRRLSLSFTSEERLDYRDFVRRAGEKFGARVDMRQLGARDRAKMAGGYGICGRELCCANWLATFPSISIRMAKEQELPLNPQKISGLCGRLLCCLSYEEEGYKEMRKTLPKMGQRCSTPTGEGRVIGVNILQRQVMLVVNGQRVEVGDRDLGLVVRWDTSSKSGEPPPSISRRDAIEQGLIEETDEDRLEANRLEARVDWITGATLVEEPPGEGRGRLPGGGPRRTITQRKPERAKPEERPAERRPGGAQPQRPQGQPRRGQQQQSDRSGRPAPPAGGASRSFQRSTPPPVERSTPPDGEAEPTAEGAKRSRRRRGRRR